MTDYLVKVGFWDGRRPDPRDSVTIEAASDGEAIGKAKAAVRIVMELRAYPEASDTHKRRQGVIAYIDRVASGRREPLVEDVAFDDDRIDASS